MSTNDTTSANNISNKVGLGEKISYGFGNLAGNLLLTTANTFISFFLYRCCRNSSSNSGLYFTCRKNS